MQFRPESEDGHQRESTRRNHAEEIHDVVRESELLRWVDDRECVRFISSFGLGPDIVGGHTNLTTGQDEHESYDSEIDGLE